MKIVYLFVFCFIVSCGEEKQKDVKSSPSVLAPTQNPSKAESIKRSEEIIEKNKKDQEKLKAYLEKRKQEKAEKEKKMIELGLRK